METIIEKLKKIKRLADAGFDGEAKAAKFQLEKLLAKHNLSIDDLFEEKKTRRMFKTTRETDGLFVQTLSSVIGDRWKEHFYFRGKPSQLYIELTDIEFVEFEQLWSFHSKQLKKEIVKQKKLIKTAYYHKHHLFNKDASSAGNSGGDKMTFEELMALESAINNLENVSFRKQLNTAKV